ncbi:MAG: winged helix-turn-helix domain-containing protein [Candidatus Methanoperedens sp.]|jgi:predicted transcriptional regulator|nr:winged helix-turn-helix domain-containing protein [Candidatus Methanoperedens sp.]PKL54671.1 MAG: ArsR family transcriptional regulator [Candidatus Methanoperedenaceae archaeon HGW-Methanoperedenaceae-1]
MPEKKEKQTNDLLEIKGKLNEIHKDMKRFIEQSNQQHLDTVLSGSRSHFTNAIIGHVIGDIDEDLESNMVKKCEMRETCKSNFTGFLQNNAGLMKNDNVHQDVILKNQSDLNGMRSNAPSKQCEKCFSQVQNLFGKQISLMRSLRIYNTDEEKKPEIPPIHEELIVSVLEPLSNKQRMQILKAISIETKTFTALSELTGLRGGNLNFHLQKLLDSGMILQRHERGDYMITDKGFKVLRSIGDMYSMLNS